MTTAPPEPFDVAVIGGGAAGLFCALTAGRRGRRVVLIEHNEAVGRKILISGGGRCNFTNVNAGPANYFSENPDFCRSALAGFGPERFIDLVERHGIAYHEKKLGQLFCDGSAQQIVDMLERECRTAGLTFRLGCQVSGIVREGRFTLATTAGAISCDSLVIATGGLSIPPLGATGSGYDVARQFGLRQVAIRPALVPLTFSGAEKTLFAELSGVSVEAAVSFGRHRFVENVLFTHRGLSGPAILQVSTAWQPGKAITVDLAPRVDIGEILAAASTSNRELASILSDLWPRRFAQAWCAAVAPSRPMHHYSAQEVEQLTRQIDAWELRPAGTAGYAKAEVTAGGIDTRDLNSKTMEARNVPGLYFIGEVVDVTGWLGGYNFQWAWASGHAAGSAA
ncbi:MAG: NAD(P)/FAD-dependent oxidoreductase [Dehalococcoidia bacterium]|nr:NAD(P)/FAD-dependent oxidoreductase [Dehalococcoidia bacterium]